VIAQASNLIVESQNEDYLKTTSARSSPKLILDWYTIPNHLYKTSWALVGVEF